MPLYDLQCSACGHTFEAFQAMDRQAANALPEVRPEESPSRAREAAEGYIADTKTDIPQEDCGRG